MNKKILTGLLLLLLIAIGFASMRLYATTQKLDQTLSPLALTDAFQVSIHAYEAIHRAESEGANVTSLIPDFNSALALLQRAEELNAVDPQGAISNATRASDIFNQIPPRAEVLGNEALSENAKSMTSVFLGGVVIVAGLTLSSFGVLLLTYALRWRRLMRTEIRLVKQTGKD